MFEACIFASSIARSVTTEKGRTRSPRSFARNLGDEVEVDDRKLGQFDVIVDGTLVASRGESFFARMMPRDAPGADVVLAAIERHQAAREGDACELPVSTLSK